MKEKIFKFIKDNFNRYKMSLLMVVIAILAAGLVELAYNARCIAANHSGYGTVEFDTDDVNASGADTDGNKWIFCENGGELHLYPNGMYVDKLVYSYSSEENVFFDADIVLKTYDVYGNEQTEVVADNNPYVLGQSIVNIKQKVSEICIQVPEDTKGAEISNIYIKNKPAFNTFRWLFFASLFALILLIFKNRKAFVGKAERLFLLIGLTAGTMMVIIMPINKVGYDEEIHFSYSYYIKLSQTVSSTEEIDKLRVISLENWPYNINQSKEERVLMKEYYATAGDYTSGSDVSIRTGTSLSTTNAPDYIFMALGIKVGKLLHLPFTIVYMLGRMFNLWSYVIVIYFAIKRLPIGKYIMAVLALLPTPLFQASVYSVDSVITSFVFLGIAYLIAELMEKDKVLTIKNGVVMLGSLAFGILAKAVYFPLMFLPFLIRKCKFKNKKQRLIFKIATGVCILGLLASLVVLLIYNPETLNDTRGGNVDAMSQLALIMHQPVSFIRVLAVNIKDTFWTNLFGEGSLGMLGHLSVSTCVPVISLLVIFTIATDNIECSDRDISIRQKTAFFIAAALGILFVWGSLYLSYNEVGATTIQGVQGRYYIPMLFIFYLLLRRKKIYNRMNPVYYHYIIFGCVLFVIYKTVYDCILRPYCF